MAESVANQAALALELADARYVQAQSAQLEERSRISRDLHDFAIQQLFASGMRLSALRDDLATEDAVADNVLDSLDNAIESIDESVAQIRQII
ncbi:histidine kinase, partial [Streptococcus anginosus]|nr:histidine kinase [Streptococcus anginosus]